MARLIPLHKRLPLTVRTIFLLLFVGVLCLSGAGIYTLLTIERHTEAMLGTRLEYIARTAALVVDGEAHLKLKQSMSSGESPTSLEEYSKIQRILRRIQKVNDLTSDVYTFVAEESGTGFKYVATTSDRPYYGKAAPLNAQAKEALLGGKATHTPIYREKNGRWISAYAPIKTKVGRVVGAVAVDSRAEEAILESRAELIQAMAIPAGVLVVFLVLVGWSSASGTARPLRQLRAALENDAPEAIPPTLTDGRRDEIGNLAHAAARALERFQEAKRAAEETVAQLSAKDGKKSNDHLLLEEKLRDAERFLHAFTHALREGLLFFQKDGIVLPTYSLACEDLFEVMPATKPIWEVLGTPEAEMKDHLSALFQEPIPFEDAAALCPRSHVTPSGRRLALRYAPVRDASRKVWAVALAVTEETAGGLSLAPVTPKTEPLPSPPFQAAAPELSVSPEPEPDRETDGDTVVLSLSQLSHDDSGEAGSEPLEPIAPPISSPTASITGAGRTAERETEPAPSSTARLLAPLRLLKYRHQLSQYMRSAREVFLVLRRELDAAEHRVPNLDLALDLARRLRLGSALFGLGPLAAECGEVESRIRALKDASDESRSAAIAELESGFSRLESSFKEALGELWELLGDELETGSRVVEIPIDRLSSFRDRLASVPAAEALVEEFEESFLLEPVQAFFAHYDPLVAEIARAQGKQVKPIVWTGTDLRLHAEPYLPLFAAFGAVFENAIEHGIETPEERKGMEKDTAGTIVVTFQLTEGTADEPGWLFITVEDDGRGIHPQVIRHRLEGLGQAQVVEGESDHQVLQHIFDPGFSTKPAGGALEARGNGMDELAAIVKRLGGSLEVDSIPGRNTQVTVLVPYRAKRAREAMQLAA